MQRVATIKVFKCTCFLLMSVAKDIETAPRPFTRFPWLTEGEESRGTFDVCCSSWAKRNETPQYARWRKWNIEILNATCSSFSLFFCRQKNLSWLAFQIHIPAERWPLKSFGRCGACHGLALQLCDSHGPGKDGKDGWQNACCCLCLSVHHPGFHRSFCGGSIGFFPFQLPGLGNGDLPIATAEVTFYPVAMNRARTSLVIYCLPWPPADITAATCHCADHVACYRHLCTAGVADGEIIQHGLWMAVVHLGYVRIPKVPKVWTPMSQRSHWRHTSPYHHFWIFLVAFEDTGWKLQLFSDSSVKLLQSRRFLRWQRDTTMRQDMLRWAVTSRKNEIFIDHECGLTGVTCPTFIQEVECVTSCPVFNRYPSLARHRRRKNWPGIPVKDFSIQDDLRD